MPRPPERAPAVRLPSPVNDNGRPRTMAANVLIPRDLPVTQMEIELFALLLDDLDGLCANDNEKQPE